MRLCVPVCVSHLREIGPAVIRATEYADIIELRIDCLTDVKLQDADNEFAEMVRQCSRPVIFTLRPVEQGGHTEISYESRLDFGSSVLRSLQHCNSNYADLEVDVAEILTQAAQHLSASPWDRVICSYHDFQGIPANLEGIYRRMSATSARILKFALQANDITDCLVVLRLLERARGAGQEMIAIAMGEAGILTRILGPSRGSFLTYGSLDEKQATAPGQIRASELHNLYRIQEINKQTQVMGLVGQPVRHSLSPQIHNAAFAATDQNAVYVPFEVLDLDGFIRRMAHPRTREIEWNLRGFSITAPHKRAIMTYLDGIEPSAIEIGAVNTVVITGDSFYGYNTDALAVLQPLYGQIDLKGTRVAVIGAGGAARSLLWSLRNAGAHVIVFARDVERGNETAGQFGAECRMLEGASFGEFEIVINTTPLGTRGISEGASPAIADQLRGVSIVYDLVYNPIETRFMSEARKARCQTIGGLQMLIAQAAEQFILWTGKDAPLEVMRDAARAALLKL